MRRQLTIPRGPIELAGDLYLPDGPGGTADPLRAVVVSIPGSSVKEQIGANYASRLAAGGIAALTFDPGHQGQSSGEPRDLEDPYRRSEDISYAIDALSTVPAIDPQRIGVLGICAGGGYAIHVARTDHRIRAVGAVDPGEIGASFRGFQPDGPVAALDALAAARIEETRTGRLTRENWLPDTMADAEAAGVTDVDLLQAVRYYRTGRGHDEHSTNRRLSRGDSLLLGFDAFHLVDQLMTQPLLLVLAEHLDGTGFDESGERLWSLAPNRVDRLVIKGARHYEMYDVPDYVDGAVERLVGFYTDHL
ncbi:alpha/beta hydrolase [Cryptosporangium phraense]|uniref:Alpha/beta hydrolase n=1 Tax=Cryptosporangium phraense TaxID=2593070 RepID=A0A545AVP2_9ACTN|nr:alpha/beta hydrolase [Cryptosporangium phraense]TQS45341.1 alpha/beta hydrolase [Cryptosporangium phraense]